MPDDMRMPWESEDTFRRDSENDQHFLTYSRSGSIASRRSDGGAAGQFRPQQPPQQLQSAADGGFAMEMLVAHNRYRALHHAPPLILDNDLTRSAQAWAEQIASREKLETDMDCKMEHIGENLAMKYNSERTNFTGGEFTDYWYSGIADYDFNNESPVVQRGSAVLSFTQIVWKDSRMAGFGKAVSRRGKVYVVGRYYPGGNNVETFAENVLPLARRSGNLEQRMSRASRTSGTSIKSTRSVRSARLSDDNNRRVIAIGALSPTDTLVSTNKSTIFEKDKTIVTIEEKYMTQDGGTYTRQRKTTYFGGQPDDS